jgi:hypothetical protein
LNLEFKPEIKEEVERLEQIYPSVFNKFQKKEKYKLVL